MINKIILASKSKVRKKILDQNDIICQIIPSNVDEEMVKQSLGKEKVSTSFFLLVISAAILWLGAETLIKSSISVANKFNVSERIISITMVAIGTSIPELAASVAASLKKHNDLAIGNLIGSNIFNLLVVIGITSVVNPITGIDFDIISKDMIWVVVFSFILLPLVYFHKRNKLNRMKGIILLAMYVAFIIPLVT